MTSNAILDGLSRIAARATGGEAKDDGARNGGEHREWRLTFPEGELSRRIALARGDYPEEEHGKPPLARLAGELDILAEPVRRSLRTIEVDPCNRPRTVMIMPGFATAPRRMRFMAQHLERAGHTAKRWGLGFNWGPNEAKLERLEQRLLELNRRAGEPVVLLGWSLGGLFARELAKRQPDAVAKVITMGSPFSGSPRANNMWRIYQFITGHRVDQPPIDVDLAVKPPVETVAIWSPNDGAIAPRSAAGYPGERDRAIALRCTHMGYTYSPEAIRAVLAELRRPN
ncbi:MAG: alpha/beta hydrolase [Erythrobacter sp.]|uniref:esterase/lipase family protein n=1 Tax=Erythrobacter sp. TaxID=1042 RepID=UPI0032F0645D